MSNDSDPFGVDSAVRPRHYAYILISDAVMTFLLLGTFRTISLRFGQEALGNYQSLRAVVTLLSPTLLLGSAVIVTKEVSRASVSIDNLGLTVPLIRSAWLVACCLGSITFSGLYVISALFIPEITQHSPELPAAVVLATALSVAGVSLAVFRGSRKYLLFGASNVILFGLIPFVSSLMSGQISECFIEIASLSVLGCILLILIVIKQNRLFRTSSSLKTGMSHILQFGAPRVIGDFAYYGLLAIPVLLATRDETLGYGAVVGVSTSLVSMSVAFFNPVSVLLLPFASHGLAAGDRTRISSAARAYSTLSLVLGVLFGIAFAILSPLLLPLLGIQHPLQSATLWILSLSIPPITYFTVLRSFIDAGFRGARNARNTVISLTCAIAVSWLSWRVGIGPLRFSLMVVVGTWCLAFLTFLSNQLLHDS